VRTAVRILGFVLVALVCATPATAAPKLLVGIVDDDLKWTAHPRPTTSALRDLGIGALRVTMTWRKGQTRLDQTDQTTLNRVIGSTFGMRVVVTVAGRAREAPTTPDQAERYCAYVRHLISRFPIVNDVVIWNEVNTNDFWLPQFNSNGTSAAPAAYTALLARCYDVLHAFRPSVNVISNTAPRGNDNAFAVSNQGHSPANFIRRMGEAYRASARTRPLVDTFGHHPYPDFSSESPFARHPRTKSIGEGDYDKLVSVLTEAFSGTDQPLPGRRGVTIWYLEDGFETKLTPAKRSLYTGRELARTVPAEKLHRQQLVDAIRLAYCQPHVGAFFNFLLTDERRLNGWQSGLLWADGTPKPAFAGFRAIATEARTGRVDCVALRQREAAVLAGGFAIPPPRG
jgi:hypothetical protein